MQFFKDMNLVGNMFVLKHFQREKFDYQEWPKHENYLLVWSEFKIVFTKHTKLIQFNNHVTRGFIKNNSLLVLDVVGKIVKGERRFGHFLMDLQDFIGHTIQLCLYDSRQIQMVKTFRAMLRKSIVYVALVKLVRSPDSNILRSTEFTTIVIQPNMLEAHAI
ncbi:hypothetical protein Hanom_Chr16g01460341 [Helianthus anomalus]